MEVDPGEPGVEFRLGDIAEADCHAIVNPCNSGFLLGYAGVNGALASRGGEAFTKECAKLPERAATGSGVLITGAGRLQARYVVHVASPLWNGGRERERAALRLVHEQALGVADRLGCESVALPAIGAGAHGFPAEVAASIAVPAVEAALERARSLRRAVFFFRRRTTLHDYVIRSTGSDSRAAATAALRDEIASHLHAARRPDLAAAVAAIDDEPTLRAIDAAARELLAALSPGDGDHSSSVGVSTIYARAAERSLPRD